MPFSPTYFGEGMPVTMTVMTPQYVPPPLITRLRQRLLQLQLMQSLAILAELFGSTNVASSSSIPSASADEIARDFALENNNELLSTHDDYYYPYDDLRRYLLQPSSHSTWAWPPSSFTLSLSDHTQSASPLIYGSTILYGREIPNFRHQQAYNYYPGNTIVLPSPTSITSVGASSRLLETSLQMFGQMMTALLAISNSDSNKNSLVSSPSTRFFWCFTVVCTAGGFFSSLYGLLVSSNCMDRFPFGCNSNSNSNDETAIRRLGLIASVATAFGFIGALCMSLPNSVTLWVTAALACVACTPIISSIFTCKHSLMPRAPV